MAKTKSSTHGKQQKKIVTVSGYKKAGGVKVNREIKLLVGTDAASEGLNLQTLSTLINFDDHVCSGKYCSSKIFKYHNQYLLI